MDETTPGLPVIRLTQASMRAMSHPVRLKILGHLRTHGPATATSLAARFELNSGATSYHLRQLAAHGFIVEDAALGNARDRWWRAAHASTTFDSASLKSPEDGEAFMRAVAQIYSERMHRMVDDRATLPQPWLSAATMSDYNLRLTAQEARQLDKDLAAVLRRYRRHDPERLDEAPEDAITVAVQYQVLPQGSELVEGQDVTADPDDGGAAGASEYSVDGTVSPQAGPRDA